MSASTARYQFYRQVAGSNEYEHVGKKREPGTKATHLMGPSTPGTFCGLGKKRGVTKLKITRNLADVTCQLCQAAYQFSGG